MYETRKIMSGGNINKRNSSIPLFEIHKSIEEKTNPACVCKTFVRFQSRGILKLAFIPKSNITFMTITSTIKRTGKLKKSLI